MTTKQLLGILIGLSLALVGFTVLGFDQGRKYERRHARPAQMEVYAWSDTGPNLRIVVENADGWAESAGVSPLDFNSTDWPGKRKLLICDSRSFNMYDAEALKEGYLARKIDLWGAEFDSKPEGK